MKTRSQLEREIAEAMASPAAIRKEAMKAGDELVTVRDSEDLGMPGGTRMRVVWADGEKMDVDVPSLDMRYAGLPIHHRDIAKAPQGWGPSESIRKIARWKTARSGKKRR